MDLNIDSTIRTNNGMDIPVIGLGTYRAGIGKQTREIVKYALDNGYRLIDTASVYGNERDVAEGFKLSGLKREEVIITTKLWNSDQGYDNTMRAFNRSLDVMKLKYVDLYLMHWPIKDIRSETWKAMEKILDEGRTRSIGVCNFTEKHLEELMAETNIVPAVNQIEYSPFLNQRKLKDYCQEKGILVQGYSPLTKGERLLDRAVVDVANDLDRSPAQVMIRWALQSGLISIPKSSKPERIRENISVFDFEIDSEKMKLLDSLDEGLRTGWDPTDES